MNFSNFDFEKKKLFRFFLRKPRIYLLLEFDAKQLWLLLFESAYPLYKRYYHNVEISLSFLRNVQKLKIYTFFLENLSQKLYIKSLRQIFKNLVLAFVESHMLIRITKLSDLENSRRSYM